MFYVVSLGERRGSPCDLSSGRHAFQILPSQWVLLTSRDSADVFGQCPTPGSSSSPQIALALTSKFSIGGGGSLVFHVVLRHTIELWCAFSLSVFRNLSFPSSSSSKPHFGFRKKLDVLPEGMRLDPCGEVTL